MSTMVRLAVSAACLTITGALLAPNALAGAHGRGERGERMAQATQSRVEALEAQLQQLQYELQTLRAEAARPHHDPDTARVQELEQWMRSVKAEEAADKADEQDNMVFFRGGYAHYDARRGGMTTNNNGPDLLVNQRTDQDAWYFGAGFDWGVSNDLFGLMDSAQLLAELMVDYRELSTSTTSALTGQGVTTNQLVLAASPKIKFMKGQAFRPWLLPVGFAINVISPPSGAVTVLTPGMQFGAGADYNVWKNLFVGADARYHYTADNVDGVNINGVTAGGYIGIGF